MTGPRHLEDGSPEFRRTMLDYGDLDTDGSKIRQETTSTLTASDRYMSEVKRIPRMTPEQEQQAGEDVLRGWGTVAALAVADALSPEQREFVLREAMALVVRGQGALVKGHLRLAVSLAKRAGERGRLEFIDLVQYANLGLLRAAQTFNPMLGVKFSTHAWKAIQGEINRGRSDEGRMNGLKRRGQATLNTISRAEDAFTQANERRPVLQELMRATGLSAEKIQGTLSNAQEPVSWDSMHESDAGDDVTKDDVTPDPRTPTPEAAFATKTQTEQISALLSSLTKQQETVLRLRYGLDGQDGPLTYADIGRRLGGGRSGNGLGHARVRQIEQQALRKLADHPGASALLQPVDESGVGLIERRSPPRPGAG